MTYMDADQPVTVIRPADRVEGEHTAGMTREQAIAVPGMWSGLVRTEAHTTTGWHHHADYETSIYVVHGRLRMEFGPGGSEVLEAGPGDFLHVPKNVIHREGNPGDHESQIIVVRAGQGPAVVNVEGPARA